MAPGVRGLSAEWQRPPLDAVKDGYQKIPAGETSASLLPYN